jgi:uncharacterized cupin superfamily protein
MRIVNQDTVPREERRSPGGKFALTRQHLSLALGGIKDTGPWGGGHPFDIEFAQLAPGKKNFPLHAHAAQTEYYIITAGAGHVLDASGTCHPLREGDHFIVHPGEAHQLQAAPDQPLHYYVIADHHRADVTTYPRTGKRHLKPEFRVIQPPQDADYYAGEE